MSEQLRERLVAAVGEQYDIEAEIGRGGMSIVYRALDRRLRRRVAIKVLPPEFAFDPAVRERFRREAQTAAQLNHPNIVPIHSVDDRGGIAYFVMALCEGKSLAEVLAGGMRPPLHDVRRWICEVADALAYAHMRGVVHRDIKPDNILLDHDSGRAQVTDFGIARAAEAGSRLTVTGIAVGTPAYMSPEQALGDHEIDGRSDIYSLGVVGYQMLCGVTPFVANNTPSMLMKHVSEQPAPVSRHRRDAPPDLAAAIERALSKRPEDRWQTAGELRDVLAGRHTPLFAVRNPQAGAGAARGQLQPAAPPPKLSRRERKAAAKAEKRAARVNVQEGDLPVPERLRRIRHLLVSYAGTSGVLFAINATMQGDPWFLIPTAVMGADILRRFGGLWADGIGMGEVFRRPEPLGDTSRALAYAAPDATYNDDAAPNAAIAQIANSHAPATSVPGQDRAVEARPLAGLAAPPHAVSDLEVRERMRAEAQMRVAAAEDRKVWGRAGTLYERFQKYRRQALFTGASVAASAGSLLFTFADGDAIPLFLMSIPPLIFTGVNMARKTLSLRRDDVDPGDVLSKPLDTLVRQYDTGALLGQVAREASPDSGILASPYMNAVRRATADRAAIVAAVKKMGKAERRMLPDVLPTVNGLVERIASLAPTLHRLDADLQPNSLERLEERIAEVERQSPRTPDVERKLALLVRQRSSVQDLLQRRETLLSQLESAGLLLQNLKLDLIKVGSAGVQTSVREVNNATQEARALSTEIGYVLGAADELRKI